MIYAQINLNKIKVTARPGDPCDWPPDRSRRALERSAFAADQTVGESVGAAGAIQATPKTAACAHIRTACRDIPTSSAVSAMVARPSAMILSAAARVLSLAIIVVFPDFSPRAYGHLQVRHSPQAIRSRLRGPVPFAAQAACAPSGFAMRLRLTSIVDNSARL
jgi:hypothetical protein